MGEGTMARRNLRNLDERILRAVAKDGAENGIPGLSLRRVASSLRVSEPTLYVHFHDKDRLVHAALQRALSLLTAPLQGQEAPGAEKSLGLLLRQAQSHPNEAVFAFLCLHERGFQGDATEADRLLSVALGLSLASQARWGMGGLLGFLLYEEAKNELTIGETAAPSLLKTLSP
jgi:AcrR family transcriptional regulator